MESYFDSYPVKVVPLLRKVFPIYSVLQRRVWVLL